jgi:hypothetical protein
MPTLTVVCYVEDTGMPLFVGALVAVGLTLGI